MICIPTTIITLPYSFKKKLYAIAIAFMFCCNLAFAQDGVRIAATVGTADPSAMLDITSGSKGLLIPRVSLVGLTNSTTPVNNPAVGLLVYNTGSGTVPAVGFYYWTGSAWVQLTAGGLSGAGTVNYVTKWTASNAMGNSILFDNGSSIGIGNPSPAVALDISLKTDALALPVGTTAQRPTGANGYMRYNSTTASLESFIGGTWVSVYPNPGESAASALTSTTQADALNLRSGYYFFNFPGSTGVAELYYQRAMPGGGGSGYVRVFASSYNGLATVNYVGQSFPWTKFLVQSADGNYRGSAFFSSTRLFNTDGSLTTSTGGSHVGYRVFIGSPGGHGIYNSSQQVCNWGNSSGAVGAGYNGSCGTFPNGLIYGVGTSTANYSTIGGVWEIWIAQ